MPFIAAFIGMVAITSLFGFWGLVLAIVALYFIHLAYS